MSIIYVVQAGNENGDFGISLFSYLEESKDAIEQVFFDDDAISNDELGVELGKVTDESLNLNGGRILVHLEGGCWFSIEVNKRLTTHRMTIKSPDKEVSRQVVINEGSAGIWLGIEGCSDYYSDSDKDSYQVLLEQGESGPQIRVWSNINIQDFTHDIPLNQALLECRKDD